MSVCVYDDLYRGRGRYCIAGDKPCEPSLYRFLAQLVRAIDCVLGGLRAPLITDHTRFDSLTVDWGCNMFEGYIIYKQWHKKEGRYYAIMRNPTTRHRTSVSWAKYIMSIHLGRKLDPITETVDHINNDKTDDRLENLQLLTKTENIAKSAKGKTLVTLNCPECGQEFTREKRQTHLTKGRGVRTFCSRKCACIYNKPAKRHGN